MSKLPGDDAARGEGPNRRKNSRKRGRNRARSADQNNQKRLENGGNSVADSRESATNGAGFARRGRKNGQGRSQNSRQNTNDDASDRFRKRDGSPGVGKRAPEKQGKDGDGGASAGSRSFNASGKNRQRTSDLAPAQGKSGPEHGQRKDRRKSRHRGRKDASNEQSALRGLRAPVQRAPDVAYSPVESRQGNAGQNANGKPASPARHDRGRKNAPTSERRHERHGTPPARQDHAGGNQKDFALQGKRGRIEPYAALDLGTNNCRLLVALPQERGRFRVIDGFSRIVRLGEGLGQTGRLSDGAMERALEALKICSEKLISHNIRRHRLIATEACRQAENGQLFLDRVRQETGMALEIIDRQTEAHLAAEGCGALMDRKADAAVLFDIGGGSSELVLVDRKYKKKRISEQIVAWTSLPIGVVTLAERHGGQNVDAEVFANMVAEVRSYIEAFEARNALDGIWKGGKTHLLGTSGTVTTLAGIHLGLPRYERRLVDGLWLNSADVDVVVNQLIGMNYQQRAQSPCIGKERADLVMAGCAILEAIREAWPSDKLRVADRGLREGILTQMMERDAAWLPPKTNRWRKGRQNHPSGRSPGPAHGKF